MMQIMEFLRAVISLLVFVNTSVAPIPEDLRVQAMDTANYAIKVATEYVEDEGVIEKGEVDVDPIDSGEEERIEHRSRDNSKRRERVIAEEQVIEDRQEVIVEEKQSEADIKAWITMGQDNGARVGDRIEILVTLYAHDGSVDVDTGVDMVASDSDQNSFDERANTKDGIHGELSYEFLYEPKEVGVHILTFVADGLEDSIEIVVI